MNMDQISALLDRFPCRERQIRQLHSLYSSKSLILPSSLYVQGPSSTHKVDIITGLLNSMDITILFADCSECYSTKLLFNILAGQLDSGELRIDNMFHFVGLLKKYIKNGRWVIILKDCHKLQTPQLQLFQRLQELLKYRSISVIFISQWPCHKFNFHFQPIRIFFPRYNKDELMTLLSKYKPPNYTEDFYNGFINIFLSSFYSTCRDYKHLKFMASSLFECYEKPITEGKLNLEDTSGLYRNFLPYMKSALKQCVDNNSLLQSTVCNSSTKLLDLPYYAKYMLIASYLASYIPSKYDEKLFVKKSNRQKKRKSALKSTCSILGPRSFHINRLLGIFVAIINESSVDINVNLMSQVASLIELRLIHLITDGNLQKPHYKCAVDLPCIIDISKTVNFNPEKYLNNYS